MAFGDGRRKMKQEHYEVLSNSINEVIFQGGMVEGIKRTKQFRKEVKYINDQFVAFVWSMFRTATDQDFRRELYKYLNDAHVETALMKILEAYKDIK